jgi:hypothetical protein
VEDMQVVLNIHTEHNFQEAFKKWQSMPQLPTSDKVTFAAVKLKYNGASGPGEPDIKLLKVTK